MKLTYHTGRNFGDAVNPIIFDHFLPNFFDEDTTTIFIGIGSILGLKKGFADTERKIVFSSGFGDGQPGAYGTAPEIDNTYDIICVRGLLTAQKLGIPADKAVADGAILIREIVKRPEISVYKYSFLLHHASEHYYDWQSLLQKEGFNFISTAEDPLVVCEKIAASDFVITEAMHGAIIADALRTPWLPVNCYGTINEFKWRDFAGSMGLSYNPEYIKGPFGKPFLEKIVKMKTGNPLLQQAMLLLKKGHSDYILEKNTIKWLRSLPQKKFYLSDNGLLNEKVDQLKVLLRQVDIRYRK